MPHAVNRSISSNMSRPSSTSTSSANAFPRPAGVHLLAPDTVHEQLSPARSTFSFESSPKSAPDAEQPRPGARRRAQYYEEQFAYKDDSTSSARDRVTRDAPIIAELHTNVIVCLAAAAPPSTMD